MPFRLPFPNVGRLRGPIQGQPTAPISLVPRMVSSGNGVTVDTPPYAPIQPSLVVEPYVADGRLRSVANNVMVDTPATTVVTPRPAEPPDSIQAALEALLD